MWIVTTCEYVEGNSKYAELNKNRKFGDTQHQDMLEYLNEVFNDLHKYESIYIKYVNHYVPNFRLGDKKK